MSCFVGWWLWWWPWIGLSHFACFLVRAYRMLTETVLWYQANKLSFCAYNSFFYFPFFWTLYCFGSAYEWPFVNKRNFKVVIMQILIVEQNNNRLHVRWQMKSEAFHPRREIPLNLLSDIDILQGKSAMFSPADIFLSDVLFKKILNLCLVSLLFFELSSNSPTVWQTPFKVNFPAYLNGSWKQNISIDVHLLSYLLPENSWPLQGIFIYRKLVLRCLPPPLSIKSNGCKWFLDSPAAFPAAHRALVSEQCARAAGEDRLEVLSPSQICVFNI